MFYEMQEAMSKFAVQRTEAAAMAQEEDGVEPTEPPPKKKEGKHGGENYTGVNLFVVL